MLRSLQLRVQFDSFRLTWSAGFTKSQLASESHASQVLSREPEPFMPSALAYGMTLTKHCFFMPAPAMRQHRSCLALRLRDDPFSCTVFMPDPAMRQHRSCLSLSGLWVNPVQDCTVFMPDLRPWDSTVSCLHLRPSVMRQHRFMPSSQTVKDHPVSCHEIALFHAYISGFQGSNLSCTISDISMPWDCTVSRLDLKPAW